MLCSRPHLSKQAAITVRHWPVGRARPLPTPPWAMRSERRTCGTRRFGYYRLAVQIDPHYARGHTNLGNILNDMGRMDEATACYRRALEVDPTYARTHLDLANMLRNAGRMDEALEHYRQYHAVDPTDPYVAHLLRADLVRQGRGEELRREWKKALEADPPEHDAWFGYAELCLFLGHE